jgi:thiol-disulfide isomerase/thioredoxin
MNTKLDRCIFLPVLASVALTLPLFAQNAAQKKSAGEAVSPYEREMPPDAKRLRLGDSAPDFKLKGVDGKFYVRDDFKAPLLMVAFLSNHCPYSHAAETRLIPLAKEFKAKGLDVVAINPNGTDGVAITELGYSKYDDSYEDMIRYAKDQGFPFPFVYDGDTQEVARDYGCLATPHIFIFDQQRKLRYVGRVDDSRFEDLSTVTSHDARNAVVELLAGKPVTTPTTPVLGCSTKWNSKKVDVAKAEEKWKAEPVDLALIDADGIAKLARNESNRLRLVNVWATWCAPCVKEFPDLVALSRRFGTREFEMVTISMDDPKLQPQVKKFLEQQHVTPSSRLKRLLKAEGREALNFLYTGASTDAIVKALDPAWPGPLPHTVLIAPGGKIIWRHSGPVDPEELKTKALEYMGAYYKPDQKR